MATKQRFSVETLPILTEHPNHISHNISEQILDEQRASVHLETLSKFTKRE